jgi:RNA polymerase sigma-70 factor, ECF subfamily
MVAAISASAGREINNHVGSIEQLVEQAGKGDTEAFGQLVRTYRHRLFTTVMYIVRCRAESEDIVQDAFLQAYVKFDTFRGTSSFYTWLYRIAVNLALSRGRRRRPVVSLDEAQRTQNPEPQDPRESPDDRLLRQEHSSHIQEALASLSEEQRTILVLRGVDECDYETIGNIMNLKPGTVRSRLHRARAELRARLDEALCGAA